jgi:hypothetical protein
MTGRNFQLSFQVKKKGQLLFYWHVIYLVLPISMLILENYLIYVDIMKFLKPEMINSLRINEMMTLVKDENDVIS